MVQALRTSKQRGPCVGSSVAAGARGPILEYKHHITDGYEELTEEDWKRESRILRQTTRARAGLMKYAHRVPLNTAQG